MTVTERLVKFILISDGPWQKSKRGIQPIRVHHQASYSSRSEVSVTPGMKAEMKETSHEAKFVSKFVSMLKGRATFHQTAQSKAVTSFRGQ